jgi:signal transduction histidine kinase
LTTAQGLAGNLTPSWRTPDEIAHIKEYVHSIHEDKQGTVWVGCHNYLLSFSQEGWTVISLPIPANRYQNTSVCSLIDGRIAIKTGARFDTDMLLYSPQEGLMNDFNHPTGLKIDLIAPRKSGGIWIVSKDHSRRQIALYDGVMFEVVAELSDLGLGDDLYKLEETDDGALWMSGYDQASVGCYKNGTYRRYSIEDGFPGGCQYSILDLGMGKIWFGARDQIIQFDGDEFNFVQNGFERIRNMDIAKDGSIWVSSLAGVFRFVHNSWVQLSHEDGLPNSAPLSVLADSQDRVWVGTANTLSVFDKNIDLDPPQTLLNLKDNQDEFISKNPIRFLADGIDKWKYTQSERLLYSYRIDNQAWSSFQPSPLISVPDSNLSTGAHVIEVRAMDRNWNIDPTPESLQFTLVPPWFLNPYVISGISGLILIILILIGLHVRHHFSVENLVAERTGLLRQTNKKLSDYQIRLRKMSSELSMAEERERRSLASKIHDSLSQTLALSVLELSMVKGDSDDSDLSISNIRQRLNHALNETKTLNFDLCPPVLYSLGLSAAIQQAGEQLCSGQKIHFQFFENCSIEISTDLRYFLFRSCRELMINSIKHAQPSHLFVAINEFGEKLKIVIHDDGIGFSHEHLMQTQSNDGFGLFSIQERLNYFGGRMKLYTRNSIGSTFLILIPIRQSEEVIV